MTSPSEARGPERGSDPFAGEPTRLHPAVLALWTARSLFSLLVILVVSGILGVVVLTFFAVLAVAIAVRYLRFRWRLEPDAVVIDEGWVVRKRRVIRRDRIQTVDLERGILHRLLGVAEVRIEAIGGAGTEGSLAAVGLERAERLRGVLLAGARDRGDDPGEDPLTAPDTEDEAPDRTLARVAPESLVLAGLTGGRVGVAAALVGFLFQTVPERWWTESLGRLIMQAPDPTTVVGTRVLVVIVVFALLAGFVLSVAATVFTHWDFTLSLEDDMLGVRRGLFTEHRDTVPLHRVQAVRIEENLVRRLLGRGALRAVVAGRAGMRGGEGTDLLLPIGRRDQLYALAREVVGMEGEGEVPLHPMPRRARRRRMARGVAGALVLAGGLGTVGAAVWGVSFWSTGGWALAVLLPLGLLLAEGAYRGLGWADAGTHLIVREGVLNRRTTLVAADRLQVLETTANPFQRIAGLATLHLRVARPVMGVTPRALDLGAADAGDWREGLALRMGGTPDDGVGPGSRHHPAHRPLFDAGPG